MAARKRRSWTAKAAAAAAATEARETRRAAEAVAIFRGVGVALAARRLLGADVSAVPNALGAGGTRSSSWSWYCRNLVYS